ncbi:MAG: hypothetical protein NWF00_00405 [Candidatus Bathyarchaeota archaeon]|nr:hypothetical protein [Candidatus Bathyarchaeota archaeon]
MEDMIAILVDLLIEKGIITEEEYEKKVKGKVNISKRIITYQPLLSRSSPTELP